MHESVARCWRRMQGYSSEMHPKLAENLYARSPPIFADRQLLADQSCMSRCIDTGDGWLELIDALGTKLQWDAGHDCAPSPSQPRSRKSSAHCGSGSDSRQTAHTA